MNDELEADDTPELTDEWFEKAWQYKNGEVIKQGEGENPLEKG